MRLVGDDVADHLGRAVCGTLWSSTMVTSVCVSPASRLTPRRVKIEPSPAAVTTHFLAHQLAAGIHDEQRQLRVLAELGVELAQMRRTVGCSCTISQTTSAPSPSSRLADGADQRRTVASLAFDDRGLRACADTHREPRMDLPTGLHVLQFDRRLPARCRRQCRRK